MSTKTEETVESTREPFNPLAGFDKDSLPNLELAETVSEAMSLLSPAEFSLFKSKDEAIQWLKDYWRHPIEEVLKDPKIMDHIADAVLTAMSVISEAGRFVFMAENCEPFENADLLLRHLYPLSDWSGWEKQLRRLGRFVKLDSLSLSAHKDLGAYHQANKEIIGDTGRLVDSIQRGSFELRLNAWDCDHGVYMAFRRTTISLRKADQIWYVDAITLS